MSAHKRAAKSFTNEASERKHSVKRSIFAARRSKRLRSLNLEQLEQRMVMFANEIHKALTIEALPFIKDDVIADINDEHTFQEVAGALDSDEHFDNCHFAGGAAEINANYEDALVQANPDDFDSEDVPDQFGQLLHGVQDFYAHSSWVDVGQRTLIERGTGLWNALTPYSIHDGVMLVEGEDETPTVTPFGTATLSRTGHVVTITFPDGKTFKGVISGTFGLTDNCPDNVALGHYDGGGEVGLHKDDTSRALHAEARALAVEQTRQEFKRLAELVRSRYGERGVDKLICEWVKDDRASQDAARALVGGAALDLVFVIDTTGSMSDDIDAVKAAATNIVNQISRDKPCTRIGIVLYKDAGDVYVTSTGLPFTTVGEEDDDTDPVISAIQSISVDGGGDFPEAVYAGLVHAIENQQGLGSWRGGTTRKALILMGDAPPHDPDRATGDTLATVSQKAFDADPVDIFTVVVGNFGFVDASARTTFQAIADANRGTAFTATSAGGIVDTLIEAIGEVIEPPSHGPVLTGGPLHVGLNELEVLNATPGGIINLVRGTVGGNLLLDRFGVTLEMVDPTVIAQAIVQPDGRAIVRFNISSTEALEQSLFQAFEQAPDPRPTNLLTAAAPILASAGEGSGAAALSDRELLAHWAEALSRWREAGLTPAQFLRLQSAKVTIGDLSRGVLAQTVGNSVFIDATAAGNGWFIDATPGDDLEFPLNASSVEQFAAAGSRAAARVDLLTVLMHELGHLLGRQDVDSHLSHSLMTASLPVGTRRLLETGSRISSFDLDNDRRVSPFDMLLLMSHLKRFGTMPVQNEPWRSRLDVNRDDVVSMRDALLILGHLYKQAIAARHADDGAEGESVAEINFRGPMGGTFAATSTFSSANTSSQPIDIVPRREAQTDVPTLESILDELALNLRLRTSKDKHDELFEELGI